MRLGAGHDSALALPSTRLFHTKPRAFRAKKTTMRTATALSLALAAASLTGVGAVYSIDAFGAVADDASYAASLVNGKAVYQALQAANADANDRTVLIPAGKSYNMMPFAVSGSVKRGGRRRARSARWQQWQAAPCCPTGACRFQAAFGRMVAYILLRGSACCPPSFSLLHPPSTLTLPPARLHSLLCPAPLCPAALQQHGLSDATN